MSLNARRFEKPSVRARRIKEQRRKFIKVSCPGCGYVGHLIGYLRKRNANGCASCGECGMLLMLVKGKAYSFHKYLNAHDSRWPADGAGTYYVDI